MWRCNDSYLDGAVADGLQGGGCQQDRKLGRPQFRGVLLLLAAAVIVVTEVLPEQTRRCYSY